MNLAVLLCALLLGADAKVKAPDTAPIGVPVLVDAGESVGDLDWDTADPDIVIFPAIRGGRQAYVQRLKPGVGKFWVCARDKAGVSTCREVIMFEGSAPRPAPEPMPDKPAPGPPVPDKPAKLPEGKYKIAQGAHDRVPRSERKRQEAAAVSKQLEGLRDRIKSGEVDPTKLSELKAEMRKVTGELPPEIRNRWADWGNWWGKFLTSLVFGGTLKTAADWVLLLEETILGLKAVL